MARSACWCGVSAGDCEAAGGEVTESESSLSEPGGEGGAEGGTFADATERDAIGGSSSLLVVPSSENSSLLSAERPADGAVAEAGGDAVGGGAGVDSSLLSSGLVFDAVGAGARDDSSLLQSDIAANAAGAGVGGDVGVEAAETETSEERVLPLDDSAGAGALVVILKSSSLSSAAAGAAVGASAPKDP
eukprot:4347693-Pleurochrysis_carterae.AAC.2